MVPNYRYASQLKVLVIPQQTPTEEKNVKNAKSSCESLMLQLLPHSPVQGNMNPLPKLMKGLFHYIQTASRVSAF